MSTSSLEAFLLAAPKVELHLHLVGSASPATVAELAARHPGQGVPTDPDLLAAWFEFVDFPHFIELYTRVASLVRSGEDIGTILAGTARSLAGQGVRYAELTITPFTHLQAGIPHADVVAALDAARHSARDLGLELAWIYDIAGETGQEGAEVTTRLAVEDPPDGLVGFGLAGAEAGVDRSRYASAFDRARAAGLRSVPHAGEGDGPRSVRAALDHLGADRIGHGVRAVEDPELVRRLADEGIPLEVCPSSNVCTRVYPSLAEHPLPQLVDSGVLVTVNTDDPPMFGTTLLDEYRRIATAFGYGVPELSALIANGIEASFLEPAAKGALLAELATVTAANGG